MNFLTTKKNAYYSLAGMKNNLIYSFSIVGVTVSNIGIKEKK